MKKSKIAGIGFNVPDNIVKNHDIEEMMDTTDEWIQTRSGIKERRWVLPGTANSDLALPACIKAIENAGITPNDIDAIIVGTVSLSEVPDTCLPSLVKICKLLAEASPGVKFEIEGLKELPLDKIDELEISKEEEPIVRKPLEPDANKPSFLKSC